MDKQPKELEQTLKEAIKVVSSALKDMRKDAQNFLKREKQIKQEIQLGARKTISRMNYEITKI